MSKTTPVLEQYWRIKSLHKDKILLFRMGDFFEMFSTDAEKAAPLLNIALTKRHRGAECEIAMCGVPCHSLAGPVSKLLKAGLGVAICDQLPATSRGLIKRAVTRILSPGMVYDPETLDSRQANYMAAFDGHCAGFLDSSTGEGFYYETPSLKEALRLFHSLNPVEVLVCPEERARLSNCGFSLTVFEARRLSQEMEEAAARFFQDRKDLPPCAQTLIRYALFMQGESVLKIINSFERRSRAREMSLSSRLLEHLEVFKDSEGGRRDTLFSVINRAKTPVGARLLKKHLIFPLKDRDAIEKRLDNIDWWIRRPALLQAVREDLALLGDSERKLNKTTHSHCNGRDLIAVARALERGLSMEQKIRSALSLNSSGGDRETQEALQKAQEIKNKILHSLQPDPPVSVKEGGLIKKGAHPDLDQLTKAVEGASRRLLEMEQKERAQTQIPSLKIRFNRVFGYYIEVRKSQAGKVPENYFRKQTLAGSERYTTEKLSALETEILSRRASRAVLEEKIFRGLLEEALNMLPVLLRLAARWGRVDVFSALAHTAIENNYVRPRFGSELHLINSRHPVLERKTLFVPNTLRLKQGETLILTGPNMSGKSALMRQVALCALLAQSGCYVPAEAAELPVFHKMFTRMGGGDSLSQGLSTFMLEMKETNEILQNADSQSLIILDEIGRGTATYDGMSLAQALLEFLAEEKKPYTLSATHYHELTRLSERNPVFRNGSLMVEEKSATTALAEDQSGAEGRREIKFLYTFQDAPADKSYGIEVARLAGFPPSVLGRARELLKNHEAKNKIFRSQETERGAVSRAAPPPPVSEALESNNGKSPERPADAVRSDAEADAKAEEEAVVASEALESNNRKSPERPAGAIRSDAEADAKAVVAASEALESNNRKSPERPAGAIRSDAEADAKAVEAAERQNKSQKGHPPHPKPSSQSPEEKARKNAPPGSPQQLGFF